MMDSLMIGQIEKSRQYAQGPDRIQLQELTVTFEGSNKTQTVTYKKGDWHCTSHMFQTRGISAYIMSIERLLADWVEPAEVPPGSYDATMISQIEKSRQYVQEPERIHFSSFKALLSGNTSDHLVTYEEGRWHCNCHVFETRGVCSHVMAMERLLSDWVEYAEGKAVPA